MNKLEKALRFAVGILSTTKGYENKHPQEIYDWLIEEVENENENKIKDGMSYEEIYGSVVYQQNKKKEK